MGEFNPESFKTSTRAQWDHVAEDWNAWGPLLDRWLGPATEALLDMCDVGLGTPVLHVAGGSGQDGAAKEAAWHDVEVAPTEFGSEAGFVGPCKMIAASGLKP